MGTTGSSCWLVGQTSDLFLTFFCLFGCFGGGNSTSAPVRGAGQGWAEPASGAWEGSGRTSHSTGLHPVININPFSFIARALFISTTGIEARVTMTTAMATEKVWRHRGWVTARMHTSQGGRVFCLRLWCQWAPVWPDSNIDSCDDDSLLAATRQR